jgi:kynureninase
VYLGTFIFYCFTILYDFMPNYFENTLEFAQKLDSDDVLKHFRQKFYIPTQNNTEITYFCGNSLGLQPKTARLVIEEEMQRWQDLGVEGHFKGKTRWYDYHKALKPALGHIVGGLESEIAIMNHLTTNLHLMLVSFYQPKVKRTKILMESGAFPSDQYAVETHLQFRGLNPDVEIVELTPKNGQQTLQTADILEKIIEIGDELALVMLGGINYYTGQFFNLESITKKAHEVGALAGYDLAHVAGNVPLHLHDWQADFAVWCSYKYLNGSPGAVAGAFIHEKHHQTTLHRFGGWWGHNEEDRFLMKKGFQPIQNADGWQLANEPILQMAALKASLEVFEEAQISRLRQKSEKLTGFLEFLIETNCPDIEIITPKNPEERGCQLSFSVKENGKALFQKLQENLIIGDWREPNVIRLSPTPLYNTFVEVWKCVEVMKSL